ncbi:MAG: hypothetical protein N2654_02095 [Deltaproteobacteria bacterium]|nr:hypothetical protein [Deltaproteobacteria bacterium]
MKGKLTVETAIVWVILIIFGTGIGILAFGIIDYSRSSNHWLFNQNVCDAFPLNEECF